MLLKKLPVETFVKNIRRIMPKKVPRKSVAKNNRTEMLLKKLPVETFVKNIRSRMLPKEVPRRARLNGESRRQESVRK